MSTAAAILAGKSAKTRATEPVDLAKRLVGEIASETVADAFHLVKLQETGLTDNQSLPS
jgi:hypothetical protein